MPRDPADVPDSTLRMLLAPGLGAATLRRLRQRFGTDEAAASASIAELRQVEGIGPRADALRRGLDEADPERERKLMAEARARLVLAGDQDFPALLSAIPDPPAALWLRGEFQPQDATSLAVVGARRCSAYGREQAGRLSAVLAECGLTIVSGGALGIDGEAHRGALRAGGRTVAVLGCGLSLCYPPQHRALFEQIAREGGVLATEHPMEMPPLAAHFPHRNRIISGLSLGVLVIEAARRSGALITARRAAEDHGREVMALPGRVDSPASAGCHLAIREGWAALVTSHADVLAQLDGSSQLVRGALESAGHAPASTASLFDCGLNEGQQKIVTALRGAGEAIGAEQIAARSGLPLSRVLAELTLLEIRGALRQQAGRVTLRETTYSAEARR
jgi:DNA processing protein